MNHIIITILVALAFNYSGAQSTQYFATKGVPIKGYDPVAYFTEGAPAEGSKDFTYTWQETEWRFKSKANLDLFKNDPEKYVPQFAGYCAYGVSENHKSPTEPEAFTILEGRLYLNYDMNVKKMWFKDKGELIKKTEGYWVEFRNKVK